MTIPDIQKHLSRALKLAGEAAGGVSPRPPVGAVIVKDGEVIGEGQTEPRPGLHAEVAAIRDATRHGNDTHGATMYCTLEPHAHQGVAPPCTEEIIAAGITRVVCPIEDPNSQVNGNGFRRLRSAGIEVITDVPGMISVEIREQAEDMISGFAVLMKTGRPQFTLKYAMSLDGKIATSTGDSQWITSDEARTEAHRLRHASDAVLTGIGTVLADNPRMTARNAEGSSTGRPLLRVILDTNGRMPQDAALLKEPGDVLWIRGDGNTAEVQADNVEVIDLPGANGGIDIAALSQVLGDRGCCNVLVESGGKLAGAFISAGLIDRVAAFIGPVIIGGDSASGPVGGSGFELLVDAPRLDSVKTTRFGPDTLITGRVIRPGDQAELTT